VRLAGVSSIAAGNTFLEAFRHDYNARFGRTPASDHDARIANSSRPSALGWMMCFLGKSRAQ
jgi:hypothetical protein